MTKAQIRKRLAPMVALLEAQRDEIDTLKDEAQAYYDERSEKWQESEKGSDYQELIDALQQGYDDLDNAITDLNDKFDA